MTNSTQKDQPMTITKPTYGTEKYTLVVGEMTIEHRVFTDEGTTSFYDEAAKDFVTWVGSWKTVQRLGPFPNREAARLFMVDLMAKSATARVDLLERHADVVREAVARIKPMLRNALHNNTAEVERDRLLTVARFADRESEHAQAGQPNLLGRALLRYMKVNVQLVAKRDPEAARRIAAEMRAMLDDVAGSGPGA
jgi:hypothetical protein